MLIGGANKSINIAYSYFGASKFNDIDTANAIFKNNDYVNNMNNMNNTKDNTNYVIYPMMNQKREKIMLQVRTNDDIGSVITYFYTSPFKNIVFTSTSSIMDSKYIKKNNGEIATNKGYTHSKKCKIDCTEECMLFDSVNVNKNDAKLFMKYYEKKMVYQSPKDNQFNYNCSRKENEEHSGNLLENYYHSNIIRYNDENVDLQYLPEPIINTERSFEINKCLKCYNSKEMTHDEKTFQEENVSMDFIFSAEHHEIQTSAKTEFLKMPNSVTISYTITEPTKSSKQKAARVSSVFYNRRHAKKINDESKREFVIPPVFPTNRSFYDENLNGGFYNNSTYNDILMCAIRKAREKQNVTIFKKHNPTCFEKSISNENEELAINESIKSFNNSECDELNYLSSYNIQNDSIVTEIVDAQTDSGRSSLVGDSCLSINRSMDENNEQNSENEISQFNNIIYNGEFYSSKLNTSKDVSSINLESKSNIKKIEKLKNHIFNQSLKSKLKFNDRRSKSMVSTSNVYQNFLKRKKVSRESAIFYDNTEDCHHTDATSSEKDDKEKQSKLLSSQSCQANSKLSMQWRRLIRTLSGGIGIDKREKLSAKSLGARHGADLNREWEVVTVRELCRRLSLEDSLEPSEMPLPEGALQSRILDEFMIRQVIDILPPRAEGYPWVNIYSSEKHGFSLATLYRKMSEWTEEMSPVLLVIRDVNSHVFGAVASTALRPSEHYYGTGDSCILFRFTGEFPHTRELRSYTWTGENQFFVNATRNFLAMGGGGGHFGLWLDADLNYGRSQRCATFDNEPLAGSTNDTRNDLVASNDADGGDFVIQFVEAFGFSMS